MLEEQEAEKGRGGHRVSSYKTKQSNSIQSSPIQSNQIQLNQIQSKEILTHPPLPPPSSLSQSTITKHNGAHGVIWFNPFPSSLVSLPYIVDAKSPSVPSPAPITQNQRPSQLQTTLTPKPVHQRPIIAYSISSSLSARFNNLPLSSPRLIHAHVHYRVGNC